MKILTSCFPSVVRDKIHAGALGDFAGVKHLYCGKNPRVKTYTYIFWTLEKEIPDFGVVIGNLG